MSWSVSFIGKPANVAAALEAESAKMTGQSKVEYDDALPHLKALVGQNFAKPDTQYVEPVIDFSACGSGISTTVEQLQRSCQVSMKPMWTKLV